MKRINARIIALALVAVGLLLGTVALLSAYSESGKSAVSCRAAPREQDEDATRPHS